MQLIANAENSAARYPACLNNRKSTLLNYQALRIMNLTVIAVMLFFLQVTAGTQAQTVTLSSKSEPVEKVLREIRNQTGFLFLYNNDVLKKVPRVDIQVRQASISEVLQHCFANTGVIYKIFEKSVVLKVEDSPSTTDSIKAPVPISGVVRDENGDALAGVSVKIKRTNLGTTTNDNGAFTLDVPEGIQATLVFSYVGKQTLEFVAANKTTFDVVLQNALSSQQEVVVVGYGSQRKSDITGSVSSVKTKDLTQMPIRRVDQALQGRVSGLQVQNDNASPNAPVTLRIRGINSVNGGNDPLVVIDGMQLGQLQTLNPNDVESIEVLKDASATAIYGARGANGVVIVTTKRGKKGKPIVAYNAFVSSAKVLRQLGQLNAGQYAITVNENRQEFGANPIFSDEDIARFRTNSVNWQDVIFRTGITQDHQINVSGGNDNTTFSISGTANKQDGIVKNSSFLGYAIRSNIKTQINNKLALTLNLFTNRNENRPTIINSYGGGNGASPIFGAMQFAPVKPIYGEDGSYSKPGGGYGPPTLFNPLALAVEPVLRNISNDINLVTDVEYKISQHFKVNVFGAFRNTINENSAYYNSKPSGFVGTEAATINNARTLLLQNTNMLTYENRFSNHSVKFTGVVEQQYVKGNGNTAGSIGFITDAVTFYNLSLGNNPQIPSSYGNSSSLLSYMARMNYGFSDRYSLTLTGRYDGSSVFGATNKWGFFPSAGLAWNISNESFMQGIKGNLSALKLRVSYGTVGNQAIGPYQSLATLDNNMLFLMNGSTASIGVGLGRIANPDLKWEKTTQSNAGVDIEFLNGRIMVVADYYNKKTTDLLFSVRLPAIGGGSGSILRNVGAMENKGFEFYVVGQPFVGPFKWETAITFSKNKNKLLELYDGVEELTLGDPGVPGFGNTIWLEVGQPVGVFRGYVMDGVWKTAEAATAATFGALPGYPKYVDQNKDNTINGDDIVNIGNSQPKFIYGWNNSFSFKGVDLNVFIQGVYGNKIYNISRVRYEKTNTDADATSTRILDRWTPTNENTDIPSFTGSVSYEQNQSTRWMEDGSYLRLKNITLGYTFSTVSLSKLKISSARIYIGGYNLFTQTNYSGYEPEARTGTDGRSGIDLATYPSQKSITAGINLKF